MRALSMPRTPREPAPTARPPVPVPVPAVASSASDGAGVKMRLLPPWRCSGGPCRASERTDPSPWAATASCRRSPFAGRWLVMTAGGDCLLDHAVDARETEEGISRGMVCSIAAAILQFVQALCAVEPEESQDDSVVRTPALHTLAFSSFVIFACRCKPFSVVAVTSAPIAGEKGPLPPTEASLRYKAREVWHALSAEVGSDLQEVAEASARRREHEMNTYTLSSMLQGAAGEADQLGEDQLDARTAVVARAAISRALDTSHVGLLRAALALISEEDRLQVDSMCIFDDDFGILACIVRADGGSFRDEADWQGRELLREAAAAGKAARTAGARVCCWASDATADRSRRPGSPRALLGPAAGPLLVGMQLRSDGAQAAAKSAAGLAPLAVVDLGAAEGLLQESGLLWAVMEVSYALACSLGIELRSSESLHAEEKQLAKTVAVHFCAAVVAQAATLAVTERSRQGRADTIS
eukprot:gnl/TRDRNA2_/TRDRNA2_192824_c0_seq1.p1 gnl/TRDRNA2_/TRDRNA2_192824_c0~~gnl/TRDRNA2_/TRDRNA2_192824_c0_seq1.p1  ORF type:complete len:502 (-),score=89.11 gnl/TRDRNA2_/TRDRNA2_192824_c0_seq1:122-1531(-)